MRRAERVSFWGMSDVSLRNTTVSGIDIEPTGPLGIGAVPSKVNAIQSGMGRRAGSPPEKVVIVAAQVR